MVSKSRPPYHHPSPLKKIRCQNKGFLSSLNFAPLPGLHYNSSQQLETESFLPLPCCPCTLAEKMHRPEVCWSSPPLPAANDFWMRNKYCRNTGAIRGSVWLPHPSSFLMLSFHDSSSLRMFSTETL